jgi:hypothetical protein
MKTDNLEFYQTDIQGELEVWRDKTTNNAFYVPIKTVRDFDNLSVCNINNWDGVKKWARRCDESGEGMNDGWIFGDSHYVKNQDDAMNVCWEDRFYIDTELYSVIDNMKLDNLSKKFKSETINKIDTIVNYYDKIPVSNYTEEEVKFEKESGWIPNLDNLVTGLELDTLIKVFRKMVSNSYNKPENDLIKDDYFFLANMLDYMYYTEWEDEGDIQYVEIGGKLLSCEDYCVKEE